MFKKILIGLFYYGYHATLLLALGGYGYYWYHYERAPDQPINFSHARHVGKLKLECKFCHQSVGISARHSIPKASVCMGCHVTARTDAPEIIKLTKYFKDKKEIPWVKVHKVKDHVFFNHKRHVLAGVQCEECHGDVKSMAKIRQVRTLQMGWCISCHNDRKAPTDCWTCHK